MITTILFDMVGVLLLPNLASPNNENIKNNIKNIENLYNHLNDTQLLKDINDNLSLTELEIQEAFEKMPLNYIQNSEIWTLLPQLARRYKLGIINNGNAISLQYFKEHFDFSIFDLFINSAEVGLKKPDPKIYLLACKELRVRLNQCIYFDDDKSFLDVPSSLGITSIWWNPVKPPIQELKKLLEV